VRNPRGVAADIRRRNHDDFVAVFGE
jgi:hypothetical protein